MDHLSSMDASFLHLETPETPMHVGSLMLFDLPEGYEGDYYDDVKAQLAKRLHLARLFRRKLAPMPFELADPVWIDDDDIDLDYHVRSVTLRRPGTMAQLEVLVARLHSSLLDRSRPLWEVYVIDGLANGQIAFYSKAHHSGVDGKAGIEIAKVFYDVTPQAREVRPPRPARAGNAYQLGVAELLQAAVSNTAAQYVKLGKMLPQAAKALGGTAKQFISMRRQAPRKRSLGLKIGAEDDLQRVDHQPAFVRQPVGAVGRAQDARQADGRHAQRRGDGDVQRRAAQVPRRARPAAAEVADRDGAGEPARGRRQLEQQPGVGDPRRPRHRPRRPGQALPGDPRIVGGVEGIDRRPEVDTRRRPADRRLAVADDGHGVAVRAIQPGQRACRRWPTWRSRTCRGLRCRCTWPGRAWRTTTRCRSRTTASA